MFRALRCLGILGVEDVLHSALLPLVAAVAHVGVVHACRSQQMAINFEQLVAKCICRCLETGGDEPYFRYYWHAFFTDSHALTLRRMLTKPEHPSAYIMRFLCILVLDVSSCHYCGSCCCRSYYHCLRNAIRPLELGDVWVNISDFAQRSTELQSTKSKLIATEAELSRYWAKPDMLVSKANKSWGL